MSDDNVRPLPPLFLPPAVEAMGAYADALNLRSWVVAEAIPHSNTLWLQLFLPNRRQVDDR